MPRALKMPKNVASTFFNKVHLLQKDLRFERGGAELVSCPGRNLNSVGRHLTPVGRHLTPVRRHLTPVRPWCKPSQVTLCLVLPTLSLLSCFLIFSPNEFETNSHSQYLS